eukprot:12799304-Prorocentrum_lima.AAC.1
MRSRMHWRLANMQEDIAVQALGQENKVQYEEIRNDMVKRATHMFTECVGDWSIWVEGQAPDR